MKVVQGQVDPWSSLSLALANLNESVGSNNVRSQGRAHVSRDQSHAFLGASFIFELDEQVVARVRFAFDWVSDLCADVANKTSFCQIILEWFQDVVSKRRCCHRQVASDPERSLLSLFSRDMYKLLEFVDVDVELGLREFSLQVFRRAFSNVIVF